MPIDELGLVAKLSKWADFLDADIGTDEPAGADCREAAAAIERLLAERDEAREALKPFAEFAAHWDGKAVEYLRETQGKASDSLSDAEIAAIHTPDAEVRLDTGEMRRSGQKTITMADFRRARQALEDKP